MPLDYKKYATVRYYNEHAEKVRVNQVIWYQKNKEKLIAASTFTHNEGRTVDDISKVIVEQSLPSLTESYELSYLYRRKKPIRDGIPNTRQVSTVHDPSLLPTTSNIMYPVDPSESKILYDDQPEGGRRAYLKARRRKIPEMKYYSCQTSYNDYGWKQAESCQEARKVDKNVCRPPVHGCRYTLVEYCRTLGPRADPRHYQQPLNARYSFPCGV